MITQKSARAKGKQGEEEWAKALRESGLDSSADRNAGSGGGLIKGDVKTELPWHFEVKRVEKFNIWDAIEQSTRDAGLHNKIPTVVFRKNRMPEYWVAMPQNEWIELASLSKLKDLKESQEHLPWKVKNAIESLKDLLKELSK